MARESRAHVLCPIALDNSWSGSMLSGRLLTQIEKYNVLDFSGWRDEGTFSRQVKKLCEGLERHDKRI